MIFTDPDGMGPTTEIFTPNGTKIGQDVNGNDGNVSIVTDSKKASEIEKNYKKGGTASEADVNSGVKTTKIVLSESLDTLQRTIDNGGNKEETSLVKLDGTIKRGESGSEETKIINGQEVKTASMESSSSKDDVQIHSHVTAITDTDDGGVKYSDARVPGPNDPDNFKKTNQSVIVGNLGAPSVTNDMIKGRSVSLPKQGIVIYNSNAQPQVELTKKAVQKILK